MSITIKGYPFEGPFSSTDELRNSSGVYAIHYKKSSDGYTRLDVGESDKVRERVETHERKDCWKRNAKGPITCSAYYCSESDRMRIEKEIRDSSDLPCGDQ